MEPKISISKQNKKKFIVVPLEETKKEEISKDKNYFQDILPCFGKYEVEEYVAKKLKDILFLTHNATELFTSNFSFNVNDEVINISGKMLREKLMPYFMVKYEDDEVLLLKLK